MSKATEKKISEIQKLSWKDIEKERLSDQMSLQKVFGEKGTMTQIFARQGNAAARHSHISEEYMWITSGALKYIFDDREVVVNAGEFIVVPPNTPHSLVALEETEAVGFFAPRRDDWLRGEDKYLRQ